MSDLGLLVLLFGGVTAGIWLSYRLFMRGDTNAERIASRLPRGFEAEWSWRCGDTYVGYERAGDRLAFVDYPHAAVLKAADVRSMETYDEPIMGVVHRWLVVNVPQPPLRLRVWFRFSRTKRDEVLQHLRSLTNAP
jgi:hypothetical protein